MLEPIRHLHWRQHLSGTFWAMNGTDGRYQPARKAILGNSLRPEQKHFITENWWMYQRQLLRMQVQSRNHFTRERRNTGNISALNVVNSTKSTLTTSNSNTKKTKLERKQTTTSHLSNGVAHPADAYPAKTQCGSNQPVGMPITQMQSKRDTGLSGLMVLHHPGNDGKSSFMNF